MTRALFILAAAAAMIGLGAMPGLAQTRVFVSGSGSDSNTCSLSAPCRSFQQAHNTVLAGGEIVALDAAGYGPLNITKAVTVSATGIEASITSNSATGAALAVNAGASDVVTLRGLTLFAGTASNAGIDITSGKSVTIEDCTVSGFRMNTGITIDPVSSNLNVELRRVFVDNNGTGGLSIEPLGTGNTTVLVTDSHFNATFDTGVTVDGSHSTGTIRATLNLVADSNSMGIVVMTASGKAQPVVLVTGSKIVNNRVLGLSGDNAVLVYVDRTQISGNGVGGGGSGWQATNGAVATSYKNNAVNGNGNDNLNGVVQITSE
jgi:hypothetical protein